MNMTIQNHQGFWIHFSIWRFPEIGVAPSSHPNVHRTFHIFTKQSIMSIGVPSLNSPWLCHSTGFFWGPVRATTATNRRSPGHENSRSLEDRRKKWSSLYRMGNFHGRMRTKTTGKKSGLLDFFDGKTRWLFEFFVFLIISRRFPMFDLVFFSRGKKGPQILVRFDSHGPKCTKTSTIASGNLP